MSSMLPKMLMALVIVGCSASVSALESMAEAEMSTVTGQEGIALDLQFGVNMEPDTNGDFVIAPGLGGCSGNVECRLALEFEGRPGKWLVIKDYFGYMEFNSLQLDAATLPGGSSPHADATPFQDEGGSCILAGCNPNGLPALQVGYPSVQPAGHDFGMYLNMGRVAAEFGATGYLLDNASGSVLGFRATDVAGGAATMDIDGQMYIYGF